MPRASRVCNRARCPELAGPRGKCPTHDREADRARGTAHERGYGHGYRRARDRALRKAATCAACGEPFTEANPATGGHRVPVREGGTHRDGIEAQCRRCNLGWRRTGL